MSHLPFLSGGDISLLLDMERLGQRYFDDGQERDLLAIFAARGCNCMRLRLWVEPSGEDIFTSDLRQTIALGRRIKEAGMLFLLDYHYADSWADPGQQPKPKSWEGLDFEQLCEQVRNYSRDSIEKLRDGGAMPDIVQIGNEITNGMIWPDGKVGPQGEFGKLAALIRAGTHGVRDASGNAQPQIMLHIDRGADWNSTQWFFEQVEAHSLEYDLMGQSYYPFFHGDQELFRETMHESAARFGKPVVLVEAGASSQSGVWDGDDAKSRQYPATPEGQKRYLQDVIQVMREVPNGLGRGVIWWAPEWVAVEGHASSWDGRTLFDRAGHALPALDAFREGKSSV